MQKFDDPWAMRSPRSLGPLDRRLGVRKKAIAELARKCDVNSLGVLLTPAAPEDAKMTAIWILSQIDSPKARELTREALKDARDSVRIAATHAVSVWRDSDSKNALVKVLESNSMPVTRAAAEALGRLKDASVVPNLLHAARGTLDRPLEHSLAYALIEIGNAEAIRAAIPTDSVRARNVALIALSQLPAGLKAQDIAPLLTDSGPLRKTAEWIAAKHPEWGGELAGLFRERAARADFDAKAIEPVLTRLASSHEIQELLAELSAGKKEAALMSLRAMAATSFKKTPESWANAVTKAISSNEGDVKRQAIATARALAATKESKELQAALKEASENSANSPALRIAALRALPEGSPITASVFQLLIANIDAKSGVDIRSDAVAALTRAALTEDQRLELADALSQVGPMEISRLFDAFEKHNTEAIGLRIVEALKKSPVIASLPPEWVNQKLAKFPESVRKAAETLPHASQGDALSQRARLEEMLASLKGGDIRRGQAIFNNAKAACISCHSIGYLGGKVGPDLTSIGQVRTEMDLLESILYPSASFVRSYEPVFVKTKDGEAHTGILRGDNEQGVLLVSGPNAEERIARADIEEMRPGNLSIMPAGLDSQLSKQELADLVVFLKGTKWGAH
jgi:putative heme-binding domain-containing protein